MPKEKSRMFYVVDFESALSESLAKRVVDFQAYMHFRRWNAMANVADELYTLRKELAGIILSGSAKNINSKKYAVPDIPVEILDLGIPVLGICYGMQLVAHMLNSKVVRCWNEPDEKKRDPRKDPGESGPYVIYRTDPSHKDKEKGDAPSVLFEGLGRSFPAWMYHNYMVEEAPAGFKVTARTKLCPVAAMERDNVYCVQFHPEHHASLAGRIILKNFMKKICESPMDYF